MSTKHPKPTVAFSNPTETYLGVRSSQNLRSRPEQEYRLISLLKLPEKASRGEKQH